MLDVPEFAKPLCEAVVAASPHVQFSLWFAEAAGAGVRIPEAAALATASPDGLPAARMVLVKTRADSGFVFYSNYDSRKGHELAANPHAALLFYWDPLGRQVRVEGRVERVPPADSAAYVRSRPRASQVSALASPQSQVIESREVLEQRVAELAARYEGREPPLPQNWGGFRLLPEVFEFWQHREDRLHDRLGYRLQADGGWRLERLAP
jgi:pyridoxamine 5'-phosphate oxidase